jgi:hypothetical protein
LFLNLVQFHFPLLPHVSEYKEVCELDTFWLLLISSLVADFVGSIPLHFIFPYFRMSVNTKKSASWTHFDYSWFHLWLQILSVLDCKGPNPVAEPSNASVEAVGFCRDSSFSLAATGNLDGVLCIWDTSRAVRPFYKLPFVFPSLLLAPLPQPQPPSLIKIVLYLYLSCDQSYTGCGIYLFMYFYNQIAWFTNR